MTGRLEKLVEKLMASFDHVSGRRRYAGEVTADDAAEIAVYLQEEVSKGAAARTAAAEGQGLVVACKRGCNRCCEELVMVTVPEAQLVARWLRRPENAAIRDGFLSRYPAWRAAMGDAPGRLADAGSRNATDEYLRVYASARALCAFNQDGDCQVYEVRPITCRNAHALDTPDLCGPHLPGEGKVQVADFVPLDKFIEKAKMLLWATHHALPRTGRMRQSALCEAVFELVKDG